MKLRNSAFPRIAALALATTLLSGCISFGAEPPERLFTLTPTQRVAAGAVLDSDTANALAVLEPETPQSLAVTRVPVRVDEASLAYLQEAFWAERPARLFQRLLAETIRVRRNRLVLDEPPLLYTAPVKLGGRLVDMGYDVASSSAVVRYDAMLTMPGGQVRTRRFEARVPGVTADAASVGPALNQAANQVAIEVADWLN
ncbi:ABC-type transport auxiliary lipoprotein family protein [Croceibacterium ferulae]|uniref:ABC-type transport auxiliary lipoprotein family protein n=1 Tax=Croceibacterium ferulae TaxID=1854641 RepID=UPI000EB5716A|nr:ABC-type transport auxiliary lipoprotein family protein [Croceibacterium ferulae]